MSWSRFDDNWFDRMRALGLDGNDIAHYVGLIQWCSRTNQHDGRIALSLARGVSNFKDPDEALARIADAGHLTFDGGFVVLTYVADHVPSQTVLDKKEAEAAKKRRQRAHARGDHSLCQERNCPVIVPGDVPGDSDGMSTPEGTSPATVPGDVGTGQDRPGREDPSLWPDVTVPGQRR